VTIYLTARVVVEGVVVDVIRREDGRRVVEVEAVGAVPYEQVVRDVVTELRLRACRGVRSDDVNSSASAVRDRVVLDEPVGRHREKGANVDRDTVSRCLSDQRARHDAVLDVPFDDHARASDAFAVEMAVVADDHLRVGRSDDLRALLRLHVAIEEAQHAVRDVEESSRDADPGPGVDDLAVRHRDRADANVDGTVCVCDRRFQTDAFDVDRDPVLDPDDPRVARRDRDRRLRGGA